MKLKSIVFTLLLLCSLTAFCQSTKAVKNVQQIWLGYFNQTRLTGKFGLWGDFHLRTKEHFTDNFSQSILRLGLTYYITDNTKLTAGYGYITYYPAEGHTKISQIEHRPWQQIQWHTKYSNNRMMQYIRLEEKYRQKILNDSMVGNGYSFFWKIRYNILYEVPFTRQVNNKWAFILNDEIHINFGKQVVYNYFDQNRFFAGFKYNFNQANSMQIGYLNQFVQSSAGNKFTNNNAFRLFYSQNLDVRKKRTGNK